MRCFKKNVVRLFSILVMSLILPKIVLAGDVNFSLNGKSEVRPNNDFVVELVANISGPLNSIQGNISISNANCVQIVSVSGIEGTQIENNKFIYFTMGSIEGTKNIIKVNLKAVSSSCDATLNVTDLKGGFTDNSSFNNKSVSKKITVLAPLKTNNNLSSITLSGGTLSPSFNKNTTNYNVSVAGNVSSINIQGALEDASAKLSGGGNISLKYGNNPINLVVTAEDGTKKTYTINVNREDGRSSNNNLSKLTVSEGTLSPVFKSSVTSYTVNVPSETTKITISGAASDNAAKVSGVGTFNLNYGTNRIKVVVKAENESTKTYTIKVNREDNRPSNAGLKSLIINPGSIDFKTGITEYDVIVNKDVKKLEINAESIEKDAKVTISSQELNEEGVTDITITVVAPNNDSKVYTLHVTKEDVNNNDNDNDTPSNKLKDIILKNGKLNKKFDPDIYTYTYTRGKDFSYEYVLDNDNLAVKTVENDDAIYFIVSDSEGNTVVYCLHLESTNSLLVILTILVIVLAIFSGYFGYDYIKAERRLRKEINK